MLSILLTYMTNCAGNSDGLKSLFTLLDVKDFTSDVERFKLIGYLLKYLNQ